MATRVVCGCGKSFQSKKAPGLRDKCPWCGELASVPKASGDEDEAGYGLVAEPERPVEPDPEPVLKKRSARVEDDDETEEDEPKPKKKKKKRKKSSGGGLVAFDTSQLSSFLFGTYPGMALVALAVVGGAIWFFTPSKTIKVVEAYRVDAYAALDARPRNAMDIVVTGKEAGHYFAGSSKFMIVRPQPDGDAVRVRLALPPKFLDAYANATKGTLALQSQAFQLGRVKSPPDQRVHALFLGEFEHVNGSKGIVFEIGQADDVLAFTPRPRDPWNHLPGETVNLCKPKKTKVGDELTGFQEKILSCTGMARFTAQRGLEVKYDYQGPEVHLHWDGNSAGYLGDTYQEFLERTFGSLLVDCLFPHLPPGEGPLVVWAFGQPSPPFQLK
jgi:hypothetical protein